MKKLFTIALAAMSLSQAGAQNLNAPQASPTQTVKQNFSTGSIELSYSRPSKKGRTVFGDLVPFGAIWRTGANNATTLTFSDDVTIGGKEIKAGKYGLLSIPNADKWTLIITKDLNVTGPAAYKAENDVVRIDAAIMQLPFAVETFTIAFADITGNSTNLQIMWDKTLVMLPISTNTEARVMKQIDDIMNKDNKPYFSAAQYYYDNGKDLTKALTWVNKAIDANKEAFWMHLLKARILAKQGDKAGAKVAANSVIELATKAQNGDYVKMANDLLKTL
ncbi:MAG TPA: DUF2911 domain-containing protein [Ferruginibacter sp.]|nr:DUF2911 domain-containing protein [Ferruginibacter sp.]HMP21436.1 DUF2911 domain-containing protein [Ferruginibacter sp.]